MFKYAWTSSSRSSSRRIVTLLPIFVSESRKVIYLRREETFEHKRVANKIKTRRVRNRTTQLKKMHNDANIFFLFLEMAELLECRDDSSQFVNIANWSNTNAKVIGTFCARWSTRRWICRRCRRTWESRRATRQRIVGVCAYFRRRPSCLWRWCWGLAHPRTRPPSRRPSSAVSPSWLLASCFPVNPSAPSFIMPLTPSVSRDQGCNHYSLESTADKFSCGLAQ